ncbi:MAG: potassium transporter Trk, partial [Leptospiraceae bacterium]|nr:potassium transporter Trk [Leptospiraceae bacterium]
PQGTAGGIKITTFAILVKYLGNVISSSGTVRFFNQTISKHSVAMSIRLYFLGTTFLAFVVFLLTVVRGQGGQLQQIVFEVISAFSTVGFSLSFTSSINNIEKVIYSLIMYVGRIGVFTVLIAITGNPATSPMGGIDDDVKIQVG